MSEGIDDIRLPLWARGVVPPDRDSVSEVLLKDVDDRALKFLRDYGLASELELVGE